MAWRDPPPPPTAGGNKRTRRLGDPEYFMLTDGAHDGAGAVGVRLSYFIESRTLTLRAPVARFDSTRVWIGGSQPPQQPAQMVWSFITGQWVAEAQASAKNEVDVHLEIGYGA